MQQSPATTDGPCHRSWEHQAKPLPAATWCMTFPPFQLVLRMLAPGSCRNTSPGLVQGSPEGHLPKRAVSCPSPWGPSGCGRDARTELQTGAANGLFHPRTKTRAKQAQEVTNESCQNGHSPERQLFTLPPSQGGCASASHPPGLRKPPALTQGSHKHPGARKQQARGSNSHPSSLFRGGHNNPISSVHPSSPIQLPTLTCCA